MEPQKKQQKTQFAVTLVIEASRLEACPSRRKRCSVHALRVEKVEKVPAQGNGEWKLTHNDPGTYTAGRSIGNPRTDEKSCTADLTWKTE